MSDFELGWVVGMLEGEGSFTNSKTHGRRYARVELAGTDPDTVERGAQLTELGKLTGPFPQTNWGTKPTYRWKIHGKQARELMLLVLPHMGIRRAERIREVLLTTADYVSLDSGRV